MIKINPVRALSDNIIWVISDDSTGAAIAVDPGDPAPAINFFRENNLIPAGILITHHHMDHTGGIGTIAGAYTIPVYGPSGEDIPGVTVKLKDGDSFRFEGISMDFSVIETPGHTRGHIVYVAEGETGSHIFTGDTLFTGGCGRIFEGTGEEMFQSLSRIASMPVDTLVYPAHDYIRDNFRFIAAVDPGNPEAGEFIKKDKALRDDGKLSIPTTLEFELMVNPFLRCAVNAVHGSVETWAGKSFNSAVDVFISLRSWKNIF